MNSERLAIRRARLMAIFECPCCGYDLLKEIVRCPKCLAHCMRWVLMVKEGLKR